MYTLINIKLNEIDPQAWLADTLSKIAETPQDPAPATSYLGTGCPTAAPAPPRPAAALGGEDLPQQEARYDEKSAADAEET